MTEPYEGPQDVRCQAGLQPRREKVEPMDSRRNADLPGRRLRRVLAGIVVPLTILFLTQIASAQQQDALKKDALTIDDKGNVGIGTTTPGFPLTFPDTLGDKISLYGQNATGPSYGFGIQPSLLQIHTIASGDNIAFGWGSSKLLTPEQLKLLTPLKLNVYAKDPNVFHETMRILGNGSVGIGTTTPQTALDVNGDVSIKVNNAIRGNDTWLRLNQDKAFTSGVHTPGLFAPGSLNVGAQGGGSIPALAMW